MGATYLHKLLPLRLTQGQGGGCTQTQPRWPPPFQDKSPLQERSKAPQSWPTLLQQEHLSLRALFACTPMGVGWGWGGGEQGAGSGQPQAWVREGGSGKERK